MVDLGMVSNKSKIILYTFFLLSVSLKAEKKYYKMGMDFGGFIPARNGEYGCLYFFDSAIKINPVCGIMFFTGTRNGSGKYDDYTNTFGTVNVHEDRNDGIFTTGEVRGFAGLGRIFINDKEFIFHYGFASYDKTYFQALYDPLEILGNNGFYYINSDVPSDTETGLIMGLKYNYYFKYPFQDFYLGSGIHLNTINDMPKFLLKFDFGFMMGAISPN